jgi:hypothetical protein
VIIDRESELDQSNKQPRRLPRPNIWILTTILVLFILLVCGLNSGYLASWWNGTLSSTYPDIPFGKINKCIKLGQFSFGLLAVFEIVAFPIFFKDAKDTFVWVSGVFQLTQDISGRSLRLTRETIEDYLQQPEDKKDVSQIVARHVLDEIHREMQAAERSHVAKALHYLSQINLSPNIIKALTFGSFMALTLADVFTS